MIVETLSGTFYQVKPSVDAALAHVWVAIASKRANGGFAPKAGAKPILLRREGCKVIQA